MILHSYVDSLYKYILIDVAQKMGLISIYILKMVMNEQTIIKIDFTIRILTVGSNYLLWLVWAIHMAIRQQWDIPAYTYINIILRSI